MRPPPLDHAGFLAFSDLLTGYRLSAALLLAHGAGVFAAVGLEGCSGAVVCEQVGWEPAYGQRFLRCLCSLGLLREEESNYRLSGFAARFLHPDSDQYQGRTLEFERQLHQSWQRLGTTLTTGQRVFAVGDKSPAELQQALTAYLGAMDEAARIRARELWQALPMEADEGTILDAGAGSGAFLADFLGRYPGWQGIFCDLPEVVASTALHPRLAGMGARLSWCGCNLLAAGETGLETLGHRCGDLVLISNLIHCQGAAETDLLVRRLAARTADRGLLVIHDFFSDTGWRGALYDLHMMVNTYNGRTCPRAEIIALAASCGFSHHRCRQLPSGSTALIFARYPEVLPP